MLKHRCGRRHSPGYYAILLGVGILLAVYSPPQALILVAAVALIVLGIMFLKC